MDRVELLAQVKASVLELEPGAEVILYGSRARGDAGPESDWDFLILLEGPVDDARVDRIRHRLYEIEWQADEVISSIIWNRCDWNADPCAQMPIHDSVVAEGVRI